MYSIGMVAQVQVPTRNFELQRFDDTGYQLLMTITVDGVIPILRPWRAFGNGDIPSNVPGPVTTDDEEGEPLAKPNAGTRFFSRRLDATPGHREVLVQTRITHKVPLVTGTIVNISHVDRKIFLQVPAGLSEIGTSEAFQELLRHELPPFLLHDTDGFGHRLSNDTMLPTKKQLIEQGRPDLARYINRAGGVRSVRRTPASD